MKTTGGLLLIVYGTRDPRVDPDHSHRLMLVLDVLGKLYEAIEVKSARHSFNAKESAGVYPQLRIFLQKPLAPDTPRPGKAGG